jgi:hypothetical protein
LTDAAPEAKPISKQAGEASARTRPWAAFDKVSRISVYPPEIVVKLGLVIIPWVETGTVGRF